MAHTNVQRWVAQIAVVISTVVFTGGIDVASAQNLGVASIHNVMPNNEYCLGSTIELRVAKGDDCSLFGEPVSLTVCCAISLIFQVSTNADFDPAPPLNAGLPITAVGSDNDPDQYGVANWTPVAPGTYYLRARCASPATFSNVIQVIIHPVPDIPTISVTNSNNQTLSPPINGCAGSDLTLSVTSPLSASAQYYRNGSPVGTVGQNLIVNNVGQTGSYTVSVTNEHGCSTTSNGLQVTVNPLPNVSFDISASACLNDAPIALGGSPSGGTFSGPGVSGNNFTPSVATNGTHTISYSYADGNGCQSSASSQVTVNPNPTVTLAPLSGICVNAAAVTLTGGNPVGGAFSGPGVSSGSFNPAVAGVGPHPITYTYTNNNGCSGSATQNRTVHALPNAAILQGSTATFCPGLSVTLSATGGTIYQWAGGPATATFTVNSAATYTVTVTDANSCSATASVEVSELSAVAAITASGPTTICSGESVTLTATQGSSYEWNNNLTSQSINVSQAGDYIVTVTGDGGCTATSAALTLTVNPLPEPAITASGPTTFCSGGSVTLTGTGGGSYAWTNGPNTADHAVDESGTYTVNVTLLGCQASESINVTVIPTQVPSPIIQIELIEMSEVLVAGSTTQLCTNDNSTYSVSVQESNSALSPAGFQLFQNGVAVPLATGQSFNITGLDAGTHVFRYVSTYSTAIPQCSSVGSANSGDIAIDLRQSPAAPSIVGATTVCSGQQFSLLVNGSDPEVFYVWALNGVNPVSGNQPGAVFQLNQEGSATLTLTVLSADSACTAETQTTITVSQNAAPSLPSIVKVTVAPTTWLVCQFNGADSLRWGYDDLPTMIPHPDYSSTGSMQQYTVNANVDTDNTKAYWVIVYEGTCSTKAYYGGVPIAIQESEEVAVRLFPNPSDGHFHISSNTAIFSVLVTDFAGRKILEQLYPQGTRDIQSIDLRGTAPGIYAVRLDWNNGSTGSKIIIQ